MGRFVVVDTETTGFGKSDRIVEIGIVLVEGNEIIQEWETLVNPERDISNSHIHGITSNLVSLAPLFSEIINEISFFLDGRIFVAHNIPFDSRMIEKEFSRLNKKINFGQGFCTLQATGAKLDVACRQYGITNSSAHRALTDARATALILGQTIEDLDRLSPVQVSSYDKNQFSRTISRAAIDQTHAGGHQNLRRIIRNHKTEKLNGSLLSYIDALSSVLGDFDLSKDEREHLTEWAHELGLSESQRQEAHSIFLNSVIDAANRDSYISDLERELILKVANTLEIEVENISSSSKQNSDLKLKKGSRVCFTGLALNENGVEISRDFLENSAKKNGLEPVASVTKKNCDFVVAGDKSSMSRKAKKAREYGIPVISVEEFLDILT